MYEVEAMVKQLIRESLEKRIEGRDHIDNIHDNNTLVTNWITDIMALGFNNCDVDAAAYDIYEVQLPLFGEQSIEELRARLFFSLNRFSDEVMAFQTYVEKRDTFDDVLILRKVSEILEDIESGDFMLS